MSIVNDNMSDTPETDAVDFLRQTQELCHEYLDAKIKAERERDDLQKAVNGLCEHFKVSPSNTTLLAVEVLRIERERDEAITRRMETIMQCELYEQERDEARENLDEEMKWHHRTHIELVQTQCKILDMQMGRDEIQEKYDKLATEHMLVVNKLCEERDEAREQVKELIYIAERAIDLAEIDFENDKFGVVSELRDGLQKIKEETK